MRNVIFIKLTANRSCDFVIVIINKATIYVFKSCAQNHFVWRSGTEV